MRFRTNLTMALSTLSVCACTVTPYQWQNSSVPDSNAQQQFQIDRGACTAEAYRAVGAPPASRSAAVTNFSATTSSGETITGQATTQQGGSLGSVAEGMAQAQQQQQYQAALTGVYNGCMAQRGWTVQPAR